MPLLLVGGPDEAAAQLIAHLKRTGVLNEKGDLVDLPIPSTPSSGNGKRCSAQTDTRAAGVLKESTPS